MSCIRTPPKQTENIIPPSKTPPRPGAGKTVRRSLEKWEAAMAESTTSKATTQPAPTAKKLTTHKGKSPQNKKIANTNTSPLIVSTCGTRVEEARALVAKAKTTISLARNMKTEYKDSLLSFLDGLKELVVASEAALEAERARKEEVGTGGVESVNIDTDSTITVARDPGLSARLEEHSRLLTENTNKMRDLQGRLNSCCESLGAQQKTYAGVVATKPQPTGSSALHSVIITSRNEKDTGEEVLTKVRNTINAKEGWVKIERVRKAKDRKVVMGFGSPGERDKVKKKLAGEGIGLVVEDVKNRDPLLVLKAVLSVNTDEDIVKALRNQNKDLFRDLDPGDDRILIKYRKKTRNPHTVHVVIGTSPTLWSRITGMGSVHVDLQRFCKEPADGCSHCGGLHHKAECAEWVAGVPPTCRNCKKAKLESFEHNAFSSSCPVRKRWDELARSAVSYC
ncbi:unnamed protein product [Euphydryas editha]|uniref:Gag-like protein n=1 Tax=Euphydryas editha TaxID=104508 RepID=A0AAU9TIU1_EUPED|nr:unnamed protein product [Euphydryas editha]